ncbi:MAG: glycosyltransferase family 9 protein [Candidatus Eiseniibacteriota bacterium]
MNAAPLVLVCTPYCPSSVGEQIVQIPFFRLLRAEQPEARILAVAPAESSALLDALGVADELRTVPPGAGAWSLLRIARELRAAGVRSAFQFRRRSLRTALLCRLSTSGLIAGFAGHGSSLYQRRTVRFDRRRYIASSYLDLLGRTLRDFAEAFPSTAEGYALVVPLGRTERKRYPLARYLQVARRLRERMPVRFLLGPGEREHKEAIERGGGGAFAVDFAPPFAEVERRVRRASLVVANDCGPAHFAHIHDVPRISLFDSAINSDHWFFAGRHGRLLRSPASGEIGRIAPEKVLELADELLGPAGSRGPTGSSGPTGSRGPTGSTGSAAAR